MYQIDIVSFTVSKGERESKESLPASTCIDQPKALGPAALKYNNEKCVNVGLILDLVGPFLDQAAMFYKAQESSLLVNGLIPFFDD